MISYTVSPSRLGRGARIALLVGTAALVGGCASGPHAHPADPLEPLNRRVHTLNDTLDNAILKPVATTYRDVAPQPLRTGVSNFFGNLGDLWSTVNHALQLNGRQAYESLVRFSTNTVLGLGGVLDVASEMGVERRKQDFGQTLARWGVPTGPYLVLPLFGPSSVRDAGGLWVDLTADPLNEVDPDLSRLSLYALRFVDKRASLLGATSVLEQAALDPYSFTRDVYLRLRTPTQEDDAEYDDAGKLPEDY